MNSFHSTRVEAEARLDTIKAIAFDMIDIYLANQPEEPCIYFWTEDLEVSRGY